jgi:hypothetical protein
MKFKRSLIGYGHRWRGQGLSLIYTDAHGGEPRGLCIRGSRRTHSDAVTGVIEVGS